MKPMSLKTPVMTPEQFDAWVLQPEQAEKSYEFIAGEIVEKMVSNQKSSQTAYKIGIFIGMYLLQHELGRLTGEQGGYMINGERYMPDIGYMSYARQPIDNEDAYNPLAPDLAVEVVSPTDIAREMRVKVGNYLAAGTVVWVVSPDDEQIEIYIPGQPVRILGIEETLEGGDVLPGFSIPLRTVFKRRTGDTQPSDTDEAGRSL
jgi:Uma2 family endonuclease